MYAFTLIVGAYLVATLASTGLAKLRQRREAAAGLISERVIPAKLANITVLFLSVLELALAVLVVAAVQVRAVGMLTAGLFLVFAAYRTLSTFRTGRVSCNCAGTGSSWIASRRDLFGTLFASLAQSAIACAWAFSPTSRDGTIKILLGLVASIPLIAYCVGMIFARGTVSAAPSGTAETEQSAQPVRMH